MNNESEIKHIELGIEDAKESIALKDAFLRLKENKDFKAVIDTAYFENEPTRLAFLTADPSQFGSDEQAALQRQIAGIGALRMFLMSVMHQGNMAEKAMADYDERLEEIHNGTSEE